MEKSSKRGKIPQSDWPLIMARYDSGETLASIARTYDCSPPAISYVVSRSRVRQTGAETPPPAPSTTAPQLIKAAASEPAVSSNVQMHRPPVSLKCRPPVRHRATAKRAVPMRRFGRARRTGSPAMALAGRIPVRPAWRRALLRRCHGRRFQTPRPDRQTAITAARCTSRLVIPRKAMAQPPRRSIIPRSGTILSATVNTPRSNSRNTKLPASASLRLRGRICRAPRPRRIAAAMAPPARAFQRHDRPPIPVRRRAPTAMSPIARKAPRPISTTSCARGWTATSPPSSRHSTRRW